MSETAPTLRDRLRGRLGQRGLAGLLALTVEILLGLLLLFFLAPTIIPKKKTPPIFGFDIESGDTVEPASAEAPAKAERTVRKAATPRASEAPPEPRPTPPPEIEPPLPTKPNFIVLSRRDYAAGDLAKVERQPGPPAGSQSGEVASAGGSGADDTPVIGRGPRGQPLYAAKWHREPTHAQLNGYLPPNAPSGWGDVACRTIANYRVEDCVELGESPRGSGLARAVRQAAWQFQVRPPSKGGKLLVGEWVSIRITYTITRVER